MLNQSIEKNNETFLKEVKSIFKILEENKYIFKYKTSSLTINIELEILYDQEEIISLANKLKNFDYNLKYNVLFSL